MFSEAEHEPGLNPPAARARTDPSSKRSQKARKTPPGGAMGGPQAGQDQASQGPSAGRTSQMSCVDSPLCPVKGGQEHRPTARPVPGAGLTPRREDKSSSPSGSDIPERAAGQQVASKRLDSAPGSRTGPASDHAPALHRTEPGQERAASRRVARWPAHAKW